MATKTNRFRGHPRKCAACGETIVFALTVATERGRGGQWMPIDIEPNPEGKVAVRDTGRVLLARTLAGDEGPDTTAEVLASNHHATCGKRFVDDVEDFLRDVVEGGEKP